MTHKFQAVLLNLDGSYQLQEIDGAKNILIRDPEKKYNYTEMTAIADKALQTERAIYGWTVKYKDLDGHLKELFVRGSTVESCNYTTSSKETLHEWIDRVYDKDDRQVSLF